MAKFRGREEKEKAIESALKPLAYLEEQIQGKKFFGGEQIGYLDLVVGLVTSLAQCDGTSWKHEAT